MISSRDTRLPQTAADQSPPICGHHESVSVSTQILIRNCEREIKSHFPSSRESSSVMTLDSPDEPQISLNMQQRVGASLARGQRAWSGGDVYMEPVWAGHRSQSSQSSGHPRPSPLPQSVQTPGWKSVCNPFVTRNISFLTDRGATLQTWLGPPGRGGNICKDSSWWIGGGGLNTNIHTNTTFYPHPLSSHPILSRGHPPGRRR